MKKWICALILIPGMAQAGGLLKKVDLNLCSELGKCLRVQSEEARSSNLSALFRMKNPQVFWKKDGSEQSEDFQSGYVDFENNYMVLQQFVNGKQTKEISVNLKSLNRQVFFVK